MAGGRLLLGPLDEVHVEVSRTPGATLFPVLHEALGGSRHGVPKRWRDAVSSALPSAADRVCPLFGPGYHWMPDLLALTGDARAADLPSVLAALRDADPQALATEVAEHFGGTMPRAWRRVVDDPTGFLTAYHEVVRAAWRQLEPLWAKAEPLLGKEAERVGSAVVSRNLDAVLTGLSPRVSYADGALHLPHCDPTSLELGRRRLLLIPVASAATSSLYSIDREDVAWLSYPLPGLGRLGPPRGGPPRKDALTQLLGPVRAEVIRSVQPPATVTELAGMLSVGASTITYHCEQLKAAGLLQRERHGREVRQRLTARGTELVALLSRPDV